MRLPPPPLVALGAGLAQRALTRRPQRHGPVGLGAAAALTAGSVALAFTAARSFGRAGTTLSPERPGDASSLVTTGPHAVSRNPMYLGLTGVLVANAIRLRSWTALVPVVAFVAIIDRLQIRAEEAALLDHFGADYEDYRTRVPRWLGRRSASGATPGAGSAGR
jgi:protein-S-isoprenylcysteine O-methyltransferase Ste14